jgi:thioredoxin-dependent peroxiredoxin
VPDRKPPRLAGDESETLQALFQYQRDSLVKKVSGGFTPICTTELGYVASIKPECERRGVKVIALAVDSTEHHKQWSDDIEET